jgi:hypothetical protein
MGALLYTDTLNPDSRFRRGGQKGTFALKSTAPTGIEQQIEAIRKQVRQELRSYLKKMDPKKFEHLIRTLLEEMGFEETETAPIGADKGVDVRGVLKVENLSTVRVAIQAKRWISNVGSVVFQNLRGALKFTDAEQGIVITPSDFTTSAIQEAQAPGKFPISLVNGEQLVDLLIQYQVGIKQTQYIVPEIDQEYWTEIIGITPSALLEPMKEIAEVPEKQPKIQFPLDVQAIHKGQTYNAKLLNLQGKMQLNGQAYLTPTGAAKTVPTGWKEVNGWDFWRFLNPETGKLNKIGALRKNSITESEGQFE